MTPERWRPHRLPSFVAFWLCAWIVGAGILVGIAGVPQYRSAWSETVAAEKIDTGELVSDPLRNFATPYISFASISFPAEPSGERASIYHVVLLSGDEPVSSPWDLNARTLFAIPASATRSRAYGWSGSASQFDPSGSLRVAVVARDGHARPEPVATVTIGYDGNTPAVSVLHYWWPWLGGVFIAVSAMLLSPFTWRWQQEALVSLRDTMVSCQPLIWLLVAAAALRLVLALGGGQYFDWDEIRYVSAMSIFDRLSTGNVGVAMSDLLESPDHPGFRIVALVPAFFHVVSAWRTGHPVSETHYPSGEWLAAFILSLSSVAVIALTYALARRIGASRQESVFAAFLLACSTSMLIHSRHFFPYDAAMALALFGLWIGLAPGDHPFRSYAVGLLAGVAFLTYAGYGLLAAVVAVVHAAYPPFSVSRVLRRTLLVSAGAATFPAVLIGVAGLTGHPLLEGMVAFSRTAVNGDFSEGWSLPWEYLWSVEGGLLLVYAAGILAAVVYSRLWTAAREPGHGLFWLMTASAIYAGLVLGSTVLHRFVVYDRLARQMLPFLCLAAADGLTRLFAGRWMPRHLKWLPYGVVALLFLVNMAPLINQRFPREIANDLIEQYGRANVRLHSTVENAVDATVPLFLPFQAEQTAAGSTRPARYVVVNAKDLWIDDGRRPRWRPPPEGEVLLTATHPRQLPSMQYHGYTREQRAFLRLMDLSIRVIDTQPDRQ